MSDQVFSLAKDEVFSLAKLEPGIKDIYIGLDWDPAESGADIDLDAVLIAVGDNGKVIDGKHGECFLFYGNTGRDNTPPSPFMITEDNRDGTDTGDLDDDEAIFIYSDKITDDMIEIHIFVTYHDAKGRTLTDVSRIGMRAAPLVDGGPDVSNQATYDVRDCGGGEGAHMCSLIRNPAGGWDIKAVGEQAGNLAQIAEVHGLKIS